MCAKGIIDSKLDIHFVCRQNAVFLVDRKMCMAVGREQFLPSHYHIQTYSIDESVKLVIELRKAGLQFITKEGGNQCASGKLRLNQHCGTKASRFSPSQ